MQHNMQTGAGLWKKLKGHKKTPKEQLLGSQQEENVMFDDSTMDFFNKKLSLVKQRKIENVKTSKPQTNNSTTVSSPIIKSVKPTTRDLIDMQTQVHVSIPKKSNPDFIQTREINLDSPYVSPRATKQGGNRKTESKMKYNNKLYSVQIGTRGGKYIVVQGQKKYIK